MEKGFTPSRRVLKCVRCCVQEMIGGVPGRCAACVQEGELHTLTISDCGRNKGARFDKGVSHGLGVLAHGGAVQEADRLSVLFVGRVRTDLAEAGGAVAPARDERVCVDQHQHNRAIARRGDCLDRVQTAGDDSRMVCEWIDGCANAQRQITDLPVHGLQPFARIVGDELSPQSVRAVSQHAKHSGCDQSDHLSVPLHFRGEPGFKGNESQEPCDDGDQIEGGEGGDPAHAAASCDAIEGGRSSGKSACCSATFRRLANSNSLGLRHSGTNPTRFQLCTVVRGMPVSFDTCEKPPRASRI